MDSSKRNVLIVENDAEVQNLLSELVASLGHRAMRAGRVRDALQVVMGLNPVDLILLDLHMPGPHGQDFLGFLRKRGYRTPTIVVSAYLDREIVLELLRMGVEAVVAKPFTRARLCEEIERVLGGKIDGAAEAKSRVQECPRCSGVVGSTDRFCGGCGTRL